MGAGFGLGGGAGMKLEAGAWPSLKCPMGAEESGGEEAEGEHGKGGGLRGGDFGDQSQHGELLRIEDGAVVRRAERAVDGDEGREGREIGHKQIPLLLRGLNALPKEAVAKIDDDDAALGQEEGAGVECGEDRIGAGREGEEEQRKEAEHELMMAGARRKNKVRSTGTGDGGGGRCYHEGTRLCPRNTHSVSGRRRGWRR